MRENVKKKLKRDPDEKVKKTEKVKTEPTEEVKVTSKK